VPALTPRVTCTGGAAWKDGASRRQICLIGRCGCGVGESEWLSGIWCFSLWWAGMRCETGRLQLLENCVGHTTTQPLRRQPLFHPPFRHSGLAQKYLVSGPAGHRGKMEVAHRAELSGSHRGIVSYHRGMPRGAARDEFLRRPSGVGSWQRSMPRIVFEAVLDVLVGDCSRNGTTENIKQR